MKLEWNSAEIFRLRLHLGLHQLEFAHALGIDRQQTVSEWEVKKKCIPKAYRILLGQLHERAGSPLLTPEG